MEQLGRALLETVQKDDPEPFLEALEGAEVSPEDANRFLEALRIQREKGKISEETLGVIEDTLSEVLEPEERGIPEPDPLAEYAGVDRILGTIMTGKEADVLLAERDGEKVALKVYRAHTGYEERYEERIYRVEGGEVRRIRRGDAALREFSRLRRAYEAGVKVPEPYDARPGLIVMEYIPGEPLHRAPDLDDPRSVLEDLLNQVVRLAVNAELVHGDLSAFNILVGDDGTPYIIDLSEAVKVKEPGAFETLQRDVKNLVSFFERKYGVSADVDEVVERVRRDVYGTDCGRG
ncbi:RIO1 family regulatory kinase/ATPase [Methanopyrus sp. SNP6]|uniref:RIO1 family regulatory kinase/ATPase domain-containing protein n=1 Tax=Methanopyrus sp. SNP6 TaxID=1937005 RepID=UPI0011E5DDB3|nr:RIO1 family regulatory kinase/ATPase [Methanopyrus sp. SNP6]